MDGLTNANCDAVANIIPIADGHDDADINSDATALADGNANVDGLSHRHALVARAHSPAAVVQIAG